MAKRRMFSLDVVDTDAFLDLPSSAQSLYFHLGMRADDDGFVSSPKRITASVGSAPDDLRLLAAKGLVIPFDSGVCVIRDWKLNNYLRPDRYTPTLYKAEKAQLPALLDGMTVGIPNDIPAVYTGKDRIGKDSEGKKEDAAKPPAHAYGEFGWVKLTNQQHQKLLDELGQAELDRCIRYIDEAAQATGNRNRWKDWNLVLRRCHREGWGKRGLNAALSAQTRSVPANEKAVFLDELVEWPPGSGMYRPREEAGV